MSEGHHAPTQRDYIEWVQQQRRDRHRRSTLGPGMCKMCGRVAHKDACKEEEATTEERLPCPPLKVQTLKLRLRSAGEGQPTFTEQNGD